MSPNYKNIHIKFKLNGTNYNHQELHEVAYSLVKEGLPYEISIGDFLMDWLNDKDYITVRTSGSTGKPKSIQLQKQHMVNSALATGDFFGVTVGDTALHCLPSEYIAGKMMLVRAMILGLEVDLVEPSLNPMATVEKHYDFCAMIPLQVYNSLSKLHQIKRLIVGGSMVTNDLLVRIQDVDTLIFETYGMTETVTHIAARQINHLRNLEAAKNSHFETLPNISISKDDRGCLVIDAPLISNEKIVTNDLVNLVSETQFDWIGRFDNIINSGGVKLVPEAIERKLSEAILHKRFFVAGIPDSHLGQKLILLVEGSETDKGDIQKAITDLKTLDKYEVPKEIHMVTAFAETENAKVLREATLKLVNP